MNTKSSIENSKSPDWDELISFKNEEDEIRHETQMLMFSFLSEIEKYQHIQNIKRNRLAVMIKTSASYITQLFRGNKPLNFETIAKSQKALGIRFSVSARPINGEMIIHESNFIDLMCQYRSKEGTWVWKKFNSDRSEFYSEPINKELLKNTAGIS